MACFEPLILEIHLYCDDDSINERINKSKFSNIEIYSTKKIQEVNTSDEFDFSFDLEYYDEDKIQSIIGDKLNDMVKDNYKICFVGSKEEFIKCMYFKGIVICLENSFVDGIRKDNIIVKDKEQALRIIYSLYYCLNSYHIFPYDLGMIIEYEFDTIIENIDIMQAEKNNIIVWNYRKINFNKNSNVVFINTKDNNIRKIRDPLDLYNKVLEKIDKNYLDELVATDSDTVIAMNYTLEIGDDFIG